MYTLLKRMKVQPTGKRTRRTAKARQITSDEEEAANSKAYDAYVKRHEKGARALRASRSVNVSLSHFEDDGTEIDKGLTQHARRSRSASEQKCSENSEVIEWYLKSREVKKRANPTRVSASFEPTPCDCSDKKSVSMTLYFLHGVQKISIEHCSCSPLVKQLIINQLMPASYQSPERALDFALLDYFHLFKTNACVSNHCFARIWNQSFYGNDALEINDNPLTELIVNNVYFLYRRLTFFAKDKTLER
ncbi:hypothetical protein EDC96DRAFT_501956 [Choanephora cucurbitarum]|nr:hypothetical protein EDC96DRAFT_501956 [Choanephora cucurbitarum]